MSTLSQRLTAFLEEVWNDGMLEAVETYVAPHYTIFHDPGDPWEGQVLDRDGFRRRLVLARAPFPDQRFTIEEMVAERDRVAVSWLWSGTHRGDLPGFPASGRRIRMSGLTLYSFAGDLVSGHWQVIDRLGVYRQLSA
ncbi:MAG: ester cyclase [Amaricoccus sp.]